MGTEVNVPESSIILNVLQQKPIADMRRLLLVWEGILVMLTLEHRDIFWKITTQQLNFLPVDFLFSFPHIEENIKIGTVKVIYVRTPLAVEVIFDSRDKDLSYKIAAAPNGKIAPQYHFSNSKRVRAYLGEIVKYKLRKPLNFHRIQADSFEYWMLENTQMNANLLRENIHAILEFGLDVFDYHSPSADLF